MEKWTEKKQSRREKKQGKEKRMNEFSSNKDLYAWTISTTANISEIYAKKIVHWILL